MMRYAIAAVMLLFYAPASALPADDVKTVAALDTRYQAAVKANDADTMAQILAPDFVLVLGSGTVYTTQQLLDSARNKDTIYDRQEEDAGTQTVRVWDDTAVVTARLWLKGASAGKPFDRRLWFSDTYRRTSKGWRYIFGQASLPLPAEK